MLKSYFPGGNTSQGFYSLYNHMIGSDANRILVIKGGPGVGKSTFMRAIGEAMLEKGYDVEYHCCSSDNGSLDGVVIPALKIALVDGTAPQGESSQTQKSLGYAIQSKLSSFWSYFLKYGPNDRVSITKNSTTNSIIKNTEKLLLRICFLTITLISSILAAKDTLARRIGMKGNLISVVSPAQY